MTRCLFTDGMEALGGRDACSLYAAIRHAMMAVYHFQVRQLVEDRVVYQRRPGITTRRLSRMVLS